jgi:RNA polymerase sigma factor (sigma-70 family)
VIEDDRRALLLSHRDTIGKYVRRLAPTREDAEDLAQDLAIVVLAHNRGPPDAASFVGWCCGVGRNLAAHKRRSEMRRRRRVEDGANLEGGTEWTARQFDPEHNAIIRESLAMRLDGLNLVAVRLLRDRFVLEETSEEIAARSNVSSVSIRMRIARLLAVLHVEDEKSTEDEGSDRYVPYSSGNSSSLEKLAI